MPLDRFLGNEQTVGTYPSATLRLTINIILLKRGLTIISMSGLGGGRQDLRHQEDVTGS